MSSTPYSLTEYDVSEEILGDASQEVAMLDRLPLTLDQYPLENSLWVENKPVIRCITFKPRNEQAIQFEKTLIPSSKFMQDLEQVKWSNLVELELNKKNAIVDSKATENDHFAVVTLNNGRPSWLMKTDYQNEFVHQFIESFQIDKPEFINTKELVKGISKAMTTCLTRFHWSTSAQSEVESTMFNNYAYMTIAINHQYKWYQHRAENNISINTSASTQELVRPY